MSMYIDKDVSIVTQVAAKIAGAITVGLADSTDLETACSNFQSAFNYVKESLFAGIGMNVVAAEFPGTTDVTDTAPAPAYTAPAVATGSLQVQGDQHGPLPAWLEEATAKAGCRKVFDNRGGKFAVLDANGVAINKRPWFKQADQRNGDDPVAFWPPAAYKK